MTHLAARVGNPGAPADVRVVPRSCRSRRVRLLPTTLLALFGSAHAVEAPPESAQATTSPVPAARELEAVGAVIGNIKIVTVNVFDPDDPEDNKALFMLANKLHVLTRPEVIRQQLLFKEGDKYSERIAAETARLLRSRAYLYDASVTPVRQADGVVDIEVRTQDVWTLNPGLSFDRAGGENAFSIKIEESNLLGRGKEVQLERESDVDRASTRFRYFDPQLLGSWNRMQVGYSSNSDGEQKDIAFDRPFYSFDTTRVWGIGAVDWSRIEKRYDLGLATDEFRHQEERLGAHVGFSKGLRNGWVQRWTAGVAYERDRFSTVPLSMPDLALPEDRELAYPLLGYELLQDAYDVRRNQRQIARTEDIYTGMFLRAMVGWAAPAWGADRDAAIFALSGGRSVETADRAHTLLLAARADGRIETDGLRNGTLSVDAQYYWRATERQLFFASLTGTLTENLDAERQLLLGGDAAGLTTASPANPSASMPLFSGSETTLRGYPLRYQDGSALALLTLEHRIYTSYYLFRLFRVGGAAFVDVGRTWGRGTGGGTSRGLLTDAGIGLRLGNNRSSFGNVIHFDVAFPFDGDDSIDDVQFLVETKRSF